MCAAPSQSNGLDNRSRSYGGTKSRRRRRVTSSAPSAPTTSVSGAALASCLAALILNTTRDSAASATAFLVGGGSGSSSLPTCFLHVASAPGGGGVASYSTTRGRTVGGDGNPSAKSHVPGLGGKLSAAAAGTTSAGRSRRSASCRLSGWSHGSHWGSVVSRAGGMDRDASAVLPGPVWSRKSVPRDKNARGGALHVLSADVRVDGRGDVAAVTGVVDPMESNTAAAAAVQLRDLQSMKVSELKVLYREGGGKPGTLRKAELIERLLRSTQQQLQHTSTSAGAAGTADRGNIFPEAVASPPPLVVDTSAATVEERPTAKVEWSPAAAQKPVVPSTLPPRQVGREESSDASSTSRVLSMSQAVADADGRSEASRAVEGEESFAPEPHVHTTPVSEMGSPSGETDAAGGLLSSGPSAVVAAARARGAAAAAASSRVAAGGRLRALEAAQRHTEAARARASRVSSQSASAGVVRQHQHVRDYQHQERSIYEESSTAAPAQTQMNGAPRRGGVPRARVGLETGASRAAAAAATTTTTTVTAPGAAALAAVAKAAKAEAAAARAASMSMSMSMSASSSSPNGAGAVGRGDLSSRDGFAGRGGANGPGPGGRQRMGVGSEALAGRARGGGRGGGGRGTGGGGWSVLAESPVVRRSGPRQRKLPMMENPWARGGAGGGRDGNPEEGDVVDAFLADVMMRSSDDREASGDPLFDREKRFVASPGAPMQLAFLGTASCVPSTSRGVSCTVLRNEGELWLFDVGEGTQIQIQKSSLKPTRITKIFITHAHGDHSFGLPGLLCLMGTNFDRSDGRHVEIYGPTGLRAYLRAAIQYTYAKAVCPYVVHELSEVPFLHGDFVRQPETFDVNIARDVRYGEQNGGRNFYPDKNGHYDLYRDEKLTVRAAPMKHSIPCVGFVVEEADRPGRLRAEEINPILQEHKQAIVETTGKKDVSWILGWIKSTKRGEIVTLPGTNVTINSADYVGIAVKGRKVVVLGDTCDAGSMVPLSMGADVVVHEATNTWLPPLDQGKSYADVETEAIKHGHSTPAMAAAFAQKVQAKTLILNHFSARYKGDASDASVSAMVRIERQARRAGGLERHQVIASWDLLELPVLDADQWEAKRAAAREEDAAFDAELLRRAREWQEEAEDSSATEATTDKPSHGAFREPRAYEHEHSRDFDEAGAAVTERQEVGPLFDEADGAGSSSVGGSSPVKGGRHHPRVEGEDVQSQATKVNGDAAASANNGLVGIMFDTGM